MHTQRSIVQEPNGVLLCPYLDHHSINLRRAANGSEVAWQKL